jgi:hypothetical protein
MILSLLISLLSELPFERVGWWPAHVSEKDWYL